MSRTLYKIFQYENMTANFLCMFVKCEFALLPIGVTNLLL